MNAVEEMPVEQKPYAMPIVDVGQEVLYYRYGERNPKHTYVGYVIERKTGTVKIKTLSGEPYGAVRHIEDPRLNEEQRRDLGAWDYTEKEKTQRLERQEFRDRIAALEKQVAGLITQLSKLESKREKAA